MYGTVHPSFGALLPIVCLFAMERNDLPFTCAFVRDGRNIFATLDGIGFYDLFMMTILFITKISETKHTPKGYVLMARVI